MLNQIFQLTQPKNITIKYQEEDMSRGDKVLIRPYYMAICHADQRYYQGKRDPKVLKKKLPMALIHESSGIVVADPTETYQPGQIVAMVPNQPPHQTEGVFFENYLEGTHFLSSGFNGFMQEVVALPLDRVVAYPEEVRGPVTALAEFSSVAMHAIHRFDLIAHQRRESVLILGDGSLSYVVATSLHYLYPDLKITVVGRNNDKLQLFNFIHQAILTSELTDDQRFDHAFECTGGQGSEPAINDIIDHIKPQGTVMLMGVSDNRVAVNTRDVLEKGLTFVGSSRSGREDFERAVEMLANRRVQSRLKNIIHVDGEVQTIPDIHRAFATDLITPFKTVFKWGL